MRHGEIKRARGPSKRKKNEGRRKEYLGEGGSWYREMHRVAERNRISDSWKGRHVNGIKVFFKYRIGAPSRRPHL